MSRNFLHYCFMKMRFSFFICTILFVSITTSCKKGCTDPLAYNYNAHRSIDNGRCKYHNFVRIDSIRILNISDTDQNGVEWDDPFNWWDLTFDVYIGNDLIYMSDIFDVNFSMMGNDVFLDLSDENELKNDEWENDGYKIVFYDYDDPYVVPVDSAVINPFYYVGMKKNDRFLKKIKYKYRNVDLEFETYFSWD